MARARIDAAKGLATLPVKVPGSGKLMVAGKGIAKTTKKSKKAKNLKMRIAPTGSAAAKLRERGQRQAEGEGDLQTDLRHLRLEDEVDRPQAALRGQIGPLYEWLGFFFFR